MILFISDCGPIMQISRRQFKFGLTHDPQFELSPSWLYQAVAPPLKTEGYALVLVLFTWHNREKFIDCINLLDFQWV